MSSECRPIPLASGSSRPARRTGSVSPGLPKSDQTCRCSKWFACWLPRNSSRAANFIRPRGGVKLAAREVFMYAITHAATALPLRRRYPEASLWPILIAVQLVELLWVAFTYTGIEHYVVSGDRIHLSFLPYSHSVATGLLLSAAAFFLLRRRSAPLAAAVAIGITSHVVLDIIHHEPDIALLPVAAGPRLGLGLMNVPALDLLVEI